MILLSRTGLSRNFKATLHKTLQCQSCTNRYGQPDGVSVHHHHELVERPRQLGGQLGLLLKRLLPGEVEDILLRDVVVDYGHAVVVANKSGQP